MKSKVSQNGKHVVIKTGLQVIYELLLWLDVQTNQYRTSKHDDLDTKKKGLAKAFKRSITCVPCFKEHRCRRGPAGKRRADSHTVASKTCILSRSSTSSLDDSLQTETISACS